MLGLEQKRGRSRPSSQCTSDSSAGQRNAEAAVPRAKAASALAAKSLARQGSGGVRARGAHLHQAGWRSSAAERRVRRQRCSLGERVASRRRRRRRRCSAWAGGVSHVQTRLLSRGRRHWETAREKGAQRRRCEEEGRRAVSRAEALAGVVSGAAGGRCGRRIARAKARVRLAAWCWQRARSGRSAATAAARRGARRRQPPAAAPSQRCAAPRPALAAQALRESLGRPPPQPAGAGHRACAAARTARVCCAVMQPQRQGSCDRAPPALPLPLLQSRRRDPITPPGTPAQRARDVEAHARGSRGRCSLAAAALWPSEPSDTLAPRARGRCQGVHVCIPDSAGVALTPFNAAEALIRRPYPAPAPQRAWPL